MHSWISFASFILFLENIYEDVNKGNWFPVIFLCWNFHVGYWGKCGFLKTNWTLFFRFLLCGIIWGVLTFTLTAEFWTKTVWPWAFLIWESLNYCFYFCRWYMHVYNDYLLHGLILVVKIYWGNYQFLSDFSVCLVQVLNDVLMIICISSVSSVCLTFHF